MSLFWWHLGRVQAVIATRPECALLAPLAACLTPAASKALAKGSVAVGQLDASRHNLIK